MLRLFFHFPGASFNTVADAAAAGCGCLLDIIEGGRDPRLSLFPDIVGPGDRIGTLACVIELDGMIPQKPPEVDESRQTWISAEADLGRPAWIGWETLFPPTSNLLRRLRQAEGLACMLGSDPWLLPRLDRLPLAPTRDSMYTPPGQAPTAADQLAHRLCDEILTSMRNESLEWATGVYPTGTRTLLEAALVRNYRGCPALWSALQLLEQSEQVGVALIAVTGVASSLASRFSSKL